MVRTGLAVSMLFADERCVAAYFISARSLTGGAKIMLPEDDIALNAPEEF